MCTVSFVPNDHGFYLAMNRDEKRSRPIALPPKIVSLGGRRAIFPREPNGGTWIAANRAGVCLALINWHRVEDRRVVAGGADSGRTTTNRSNTEPASAPPATIFESRGQVTAALAGAGCSDDIADAMTAMTLRKFRPFRLVAIVPAERALIEWRWDLELLTARTHQWERNHWFSSGFEEATAELKRAHICNAAREEKSPDSLSSLRLLHQSHAPERGPFSICMHRSNAATVSYTEVAVSPTRLVMRYKDGAPCSDSPMLELTLSPGR